MSTPYTHEAHGKHCRSMFDQNIVAERQHVQVKKSGVVYCAQIVGPYTLPNGPECWIVESLSPEVARFTVSVKNVRLCGDSACGCAQAQEQGGPRSAGGFLATALQAQDFTGFSAPGFSQAGVVAPPDSLNFEKLTISEVVQ